MTAATVSTRTAATRSVIPIAAAAALGGFLFGYDTAIINGAGTAIQHVYHLGPTAKGFVISSALLGSVVGAWFAGPIGDRIGRVRTMIIAAILFIASVIGSALAVAAAAQWLANWAISTTFPTLASAGLVFAYGLYATFAFLALIFVLRAVRETKGRELEDM